MELPAAYWDAVYQRTSADAVSWFDAEADASLRMVVAAAHGEAPSSVVDVGAGASLLADRLLDRGCGDVTLLDVSHEALDVVRGRLGHHAAVSYVVADVTSWRPQRSFAVWHDRAVFHFLVEQRDRTAYAATVGAALETGGALVIGTFAADGPTSCSGLPTMRYSSEELASCFPELVVEHTERQEHRTPGGAVQPFTWLTLRRT